MHSVSLEEIHRDPALLDRALERGELVDILDHGKIAGTLVPAMGDGTDRHSARGFPISKGLISFGVTEVARIEREADPR